MVLVVYNVTKLGVYVYYMKAGITAAGMEFVRKK
jgi:hypothetical protein